MFLALNHVLCTGGQRPEFGHFMEIAISTHRILHAHRCSYVIKCNFLGYFEYDPVTSKIEQMTLDFYMANGQPSTNN